MVRSRRASLDELLQPLSLNHLKELCRAFDRDVPGRKGGSRRASHGIEPQEDPTGGNDVSAP